jgi:uncharacterized protein YndB with AHSA1/START domain
MSLSAVQTEAKPEFVITRTVDAPRDLVWKAWTEADRLEKWWGPKGCKIRVAKFDLRPGGVFHYAMVFGADREMWGRFTYREIKAPERLVFTSSFSDPGGGITRAPFPDIGPTWPLEIHNVMTLTEEGGKTTITVHGTPLTDIEVELKTFIGLFDGMRQGFGGTFDQLEDYLRNADLKGTD